MLSTRTTRRRLRSQSVTEGRDVGQAGTLLGGRRFFDIALLHAVAEHAAWIAVLVAAFERGGAGASGIAAAAQLVPAALAAPFVAAAGDRFPRHQVVRIALVVLAASAAAIAIMLRFEAPLAATYAGAAVFTLALSATPSSMASLLVHHAGSPAQLTRWNAAAVVVKSGGSLIGPLATAVVLALAGPSAAFVGIAAVCLLALALAMRVPPDDRISSPVGLADVADDSWEGLRYAAGHRNTRRTVGFLTASQVVVGGLDVIILAVAFDQLDRAGSAAALITASFAAGAVVTSAAATRHQHARLVAFLAAGVCLLTLPLLVLGDLTTLFGVALLVAVLGAGNALVDIGGNTLLQRATPETMTSRVVGLLDSMSMLGAAAGAMLTGAVLAGHDRSETFVAFAIVSLAVLLVATAALVPVERSVAPADPDEVALLRRIPFFAPLPLPTVERLVGALEQRDLDPGTDVIVEGTTGHEFFILVSGAVDVFVDERVVDTIVAPGYFGEVALLRNTVRNATITTTMPCTIKTIEQRPFLDAVLRTTTSSASLAEVAERRSRNTGPSGRTG